jgi:hypothetical protein
MITLPTLTAFLKACAWAKHCWPIELSMTKIISSGDTTLYTCFISSKRSASCLCLPDVSTIIRSIPYFLNYATPYSAIATGSV